VASTNRCRTTVRALAWLSLPAALLLSCGAPAPDSPAPAEVPQTRPSTPSTVRATVQARPGGPLEDVEMAVHPVPVDPPSVPAAEATLAADELVLGLILDGRPMAYPIRYLALHEVVNDRVGDTPVAPTW